MLSPRRSTALLLPLLRSASMLLSPSAPLDSCLPMGQAGEAALLYQALAFVLQRCLVRPPASCNRCPGSAAGQQTGLASCCYLALSPSTALGPVCAMPRGLSGSSAVHLLDSTAPSASREKGPCLALLPGLLPSGFRGFQGSAAPFAMACKTPRTCCSPETRLIEPEAATKDLRTKLWAEFESWALANGIGLEIFDPAAPFDIDAINAVLSHFGRELFAAGRPYGHFSETINALSARIPKARRLLQPSWDIAFNWMRREPHVHHLAMPWQVLLSMITVCYMWGWPTVAGILALAWGGLARIGEVLSARRKDLVLPVDLDDTVPYALLSIKEPKTRNRAARHQALKLRPARSPGDSVFRFCRLATLRASLAHVWTDAAKPL